MSATGRNSGYDKQNGAAGTAHHNAYTDAYEAWSGFYQKLSDEGMGLFQKSMEMAQGMMPATPSTELMNIWMENYQEFVRRMTQDPSSGFTGDYRKLYEAWLETWTKNLDVYMRSPEFAAKSGRDLEIFSDIKKRFGQFMESYWEAIHLPSSADMREIYHKLYIIDRKLDELDRRMRTSEQENKPARGEKKE